MALQLELGLKLFWIWGSAETIKLIKVTFEWVVDLDGLLHAFLDLTHVQVDLCNFFEKRVQHDLRIKQFQKVKKDKRYIPHMSVKFCRILSPLTYVRWVSWNLSYFGLLFLVRGRVLQDFYSFLEVDALWFEHILLLFQWVEHFAKAFQKVVLVDPQIEAVFVLDSAETDQTVFESFSYTLFQIEVKFAWNRVTYCLIRWVQVYYLGIGLVKSF